MSIKYHQNGIGNEYGADHTLTNNWNPDRDYGNEYVKVYFRIDTPTYNFNSGFHSTEDRDAWNTEVSNLIKVLMLLAYYRISREDAEKCNEESRGRCLGIFLFTREF